MTSRARRVPDDGLSHEGHLLDANSEPVDGEREITTKLFAPRPAPTGVFA